MLDAGYEVVSLARRKPPQSHAKLHAVEVDLMDAAATGQAAADVASRFAVTHVVHNAGVVRPALLPDVELDDLQALSQLHLGAAIALVQAALPAMKKNRFGRIVLMSSRGALGLATRTAYAATKAGMVGMARTWALELAGDGITVNVVAPGPISDTEMFREHRPGKQRARKGARRGDPGEAAGPKRRRRAGGDVLLRPREWLRHRPDALCLRRCKPGDDRHLTHCQRPREVSRKISRHG